jgi:long-subunit acyl-CoA synthetase (AMP-forming)
LFCCTVSRTASKHVADAHRYFGRAAHPAIKAVIEAGSDLVTPTMKLKRKSIVATYATEIETLYS